MHSVSFPGCLGPHAQFTSWVSLPLWYGCLLSLLWLPCTSGLSLGLSMFYLNFGPWKAPWPIRQTTLGSVDKSQAPGFIPEQVWDLGKPYFFPLLLSIDNNELSSQGDYEEITIEIICTILGSSQDKGTMLIGRDLPSLSTKSLAPRPGKFQPQTNGHGSICHRVILSGFLLSQCSSFMGTNILTHPHSQLRDIPRPSQGC